MNIRKIWDISVGLNENTVIYPGTPVFISEPIKSAATGSRLTKLTLCTHFGTHLDAPLHVVDGGASMDQLGLNPFIGSCQVIDCTQSIMKISLDDVKKMKIKAGDRVLFKTSNSKRGLGTFYEDFVYLSPEAALYLAETNIALVGIDYFSIKQKGSPDNTPHTALLAKNIPILEGIDLGDVSPGEYTLIALPLKFIGLDGTPCRAVLVN